MGKHYILSFTPEEDAVDIGNGRYLIEQEFSPQETAAFEKCAEEWDFMSRYDLRYYDSCLICFMDDGFYNLAFSVPTPSEYVIKDGNLIGFIHGAYHFFEIAKPETHTVTVDLDDEMYATARYTLRYRPRTGARMSEDGKTLLTYSMINNGPVHIPEGVEKIEVGAFANSRITEVFFPKSLKFIPSLAFDSCLDLETIHFAGEPINYAHGAFQRCHKLKL